MCGIFAYSGNKTNASNIILQGLKSLEYRGYDSWGIATKKNDLSLFLEKHVGKIGQAAIPTMHSSIGIGHTRWATHGGVTDANAHPHASNDKKVVVVHNGIVENYLELKKDLQTKGYTFKSETDTEVIANLLSEIRKQEDNNQEAVRKTFLKLTGRNAIVIFLPETNEIVIAKNGSPIVIGYGKNEMFASSDASALLPHTREVLFLNDGEMACITNHNVTYQFIETGESTVHSPQKLDWDIEEAEKGSYDHFMLKEIMEQDETILRAISHPKKNVEEIANAIKHSYGSYFVGCGTAAHACRTATYIFSIIAKRHINFCIGSEFEYLEHFLTDKSLVVAASQSGETADILDAIKAAKQYKSKIVALVNVVGSSLDREADMTLPLNAGPEIAVLSTKAFTAKLTLFYLLAFTLSDKYVEGKKILSETASKAKELLGDFSLLEQIKEIAEKIYVHNDIYILGRGLSYPIALEAAHKIKESSYIHAEGFAGGEPKHCEISLVSKGTPTIVFVPNDETKWAILSNAIEYKARGAYIIGIGPENHEVFDEHICVPDVGVTSSMLNLLPTQILAYYLAVKRGNDPDKPRNLAKSVTVK